MSPVTGKEIQKVDQKYNDDGRRHVKFLHDLCLPLRPATLCFGKLAAISYFGNPVLSSVILPGQSVYQDVGLWSGRVSALLRRRESV